MIVKTKELTAFQAAAREAIRAAMKKLQSSHGIEPQAAAAVLKEQASEVLSEEAHKALAAVMAPTGYGATTPKPSVAKTRGKKAPAAKARKRA